jgi:hypothetical protein
MRGERFIGSDGVNTGSLWNSGGSDSLSKVLMQAHCFFRFAKCLSHNEGHSVLPRIEPWYFRTIGRRPRLDGGNPSSRKRCFVRQGTQETLTLGAKHRKLQASNIQAPEKFQVPSSKKARRQMFGVWSLEFLWSLVLGVWSFSHGLVSIYEEALRPYDAAAC